jgi:acid stress-induced BolA-like protein IbaG/YrbA
MSKVQDYVTGVQSALTRRLNLQTPRFALESAGSRVSGSIISPSFRGMSDTERQRRIWDALDAEYGPESVQRAGTLLAFTPDEWDLGEVTDTHEPPAGG